MAAQYPAFALGLSGMIRCVSAGFDDLGFPVAFAVDWEPDFPGDGSGGVGTIGFDRDGSVMADFRSAWGAPVAISLLPDDGPAWLGLFAAGGLGTLRGAFATASPRTILVLADGLAYLVDVLSPAAGAVMAHDQVTQVVRVDGSDLVVLVRPFDMVAIGPDGIAWRTTRIALDDLRVLGAGRGGIVCSADTGGGTETFTLDPSTGEQTEGTRLDSFWPPDALA